MGNAEIAYNGKKVLDIIEKHVGVEHIDIVLEYLIKKGIEFLSRLTEKQILSLEGSCGFSKEVIQGMAFAAVEIAKTCDCYDDIFPFIGMVYNYYDNETDDWDDWDD